MLDDFWVGMLFVLACIVMMVCCVAWKYAVTMFDGRPAVRWHRYAGRFIHRVEFAGQPYYVTDKDRIAKAWLAEFVRRRRMPVTTGVRIRLVSARTRFRWITQMRPIGGLVLCLSEPDIELRRLAIWLLGRCGVPTGARDVGFFESSRDSVTRRHVAIALKRMDRFVELQSIALNDPDPRIRLVAVRRLRDKRRSHADRLRDYVTHRGGELIRPGTFITRMPLFIAPTVGIGTPVKSRQWIRRLLEHIQQLVRQSSSRRMRRL